MRQKILYFFIITGLAVSISGQAPRFYDPEFVTCQGDTIDVIFFSSPVTCDWDNDGDKDLLVGQFFYGYISFYENIGTNYVPVFGDSHFLYADDSIITLPYS
ncbi:MAG: hypothetical protein WBB37_02460 [bacterium]